MTHQQRPRLVDVHLVMKNQMKSLILMTNARLVNHAVHAMIAEIVVTAEIVRLAVSNHQMNLQNQLSMSVPMASH
jgi:hypothetical protein